MNATQPNNSESQQSGAASNGKPLRIVIVGGVAGGATAAARARRTNATAQITILEKGPAVSFANCGLPYHIGGEIAERKKLLVATPSCFAIDSRSTFAPVAKYSSIEQAALSQLLIIKRVRILRWLMID